MIFLAAWFQTIRIATQISHYQATEIVQHPTKWYSGGQRHAYHQRGTHGAVDNVQQGSRADPTSVKAWVRSDLGSAMWK